MSITLKLEGFEDLLKDVQKADANVDKAARQCITEAANIMHSELIMQMNAANVSSSLTSRMPAPEIKAENNRYTARVGFEKGAYNPSDPSDAYKVIFINYGTPRRTKHGKVKARRFIEKAKKKAKTKIKKAQEETLKEIIGGLEG